MNDRVPTPRASSIRWKLALTYAGIALLSVAILGTVLVVVLGNYFAQSEDRYLNAVALRASQELTSPRAATQDLKTTTAFLALASQVRVRVLDSNGELIADSGLPTEIDPAILAPRFERRDGERERLPSPLGSGIFGSEQVGGRSDRVLRSVILSNAGVPMGTLLLSDGPASGRGVLRSVAEALALSGVIAVLLAAWVGFAIAGRATRPIVALTDASDRMADGDLAARASVEQADEIGKLASSFNTMAGRIEVTVTTLRRFVADAAHEIGTPLTALQADLELAEAAPTTEDERTFVRRALTQARRIENLSSNLLRLSRLEAGEMAGADERIDLTSLVSAAADAAASRAEQAGLEFASIVPATSVTVLGDASKLQVVVDNLVDNAFKFTPEGGSVETGVLAEEDHALLWVSDSGIGIPDAEQPEVFDRFYRARNVAAYPGSGLGLAIVLATVESYGGTVSMTSGERGTRFEVRLPLA